MIAGISINDLAREVQTQAAQKRDFIVSSNSLLFCDDGAHMQFGLNGEDMTYKLRPYAHQQFAEFTKIPRPYYDRMRQEAPELLAWNVNLWLDRAQNPRLVRTLGDEARAFLSNGYRPLDNTDLFQHLLPVLADGGLEIMSTNLTETRLYIQARFPKVEGEVKVGDVVQSGVIIQNSEVGAGSIAIEPFTYRLVCKNGMILRDHGMRRSHVGKRQGSLGTNEEFFSNETKRVTDHAFWLQCRDTVKACIDPKTFNTMLDSMRRAAGVEIGRPQDAVEVVTKAYGFNEGEQGSILEHLAKGGDMSLWGLANAITRTAEDAKDYDRAIELEAIGGRAIELPARAFTVAPGRN